jgi:hypothetical protein
MTSPELPGRSQQPKPSSALDVFERIVEDTAKTTRTATLLLVMGLCLACVMGCAVYLAQLQPLIPLTASAGALCTWLLRKLHQHRR